MNEVAKTHVWNVNFIKNYYISLFVFVFFGRLFRRSFFVWLNNKRCESLIKSSPMCRVAMLSTRVFLSDYISFVRSMCHTRKQRSLSSMSMNEFYYFN